MKIKYLKEGIMWFLAVVAALLGIIGLSLLAIGSYFMILFDKLLRYVTVKLSFHGSKK